MFIVSSPGYGVIYTLTKEFNEIEAPRRFKNLQSLMSGKTTLISANDLMMDKSEISELEKISKMFDGKLIVSIDQNTYNKVKHINNADVFVLN